MDGMRGMNRRQEEGWGMTPPEMGHNYVAISPREQRAIGGRGTSFMSSPDPHPLAEE